VIDSGGSRWGRNSAGLWLKGHLNAKVEALAKAGSVPPLLILDIAITAPGLSLGRAALNAALLSGLASGISLL
jgi:hypothetical protein